MKAEYIDHMGDDLRVVNAARVSFSKESDWIEYRSDPDKLTLSPKDESLISYLARHNHWTPFSHCIISLRETVPIFVARQRFKHTVGFSYNEVSRRYVDDEPDFFIPLAWRGRPKNAKQGSSGVLTDLYDDIDSYYRILLDEAMDCYRKLLEHGVAPEQARMVLPQSMYTSYYVTGSLAAWARAFNLRSDSHAQLEIRELAQQWNDIIQPLYPISWKALTQNEKTTTTDYPSVPTSSGFAISLGTGDTMPDG